MSPGHLLGIQSCTQKKLRFTWFGTAFDGLRIGLKPMFIKNEKGRSFNVETALAKVVEGLPKVVEGRTLKHPIAPYRTLLHPIAPF